MRSTAGSPEARRGIEPHINPTGRAHDRIGGLNLPTPGIAPQQNLGGWSPAPGAAPHMPADGSTPQWTTAGGSVPQWVTESPRSGAGGARAWVGIGVAATVLAAGAAAVVVAGGPEEASADGTPSMVSALTTSSGTRAPARRQETNAGPPVVAGYQVVVAPESGAAYDVPADWTVGDSGGFGKPPNAVGGKGYATEGKDYCPGSTRTVAFVTGSDNTDTVGAATELGTKTAKIAYPNAPGGGVPGVPQPLDSLDGAQHGTFVETRGAITDAKPGCATEYSVYTFATGADIGSFVMVIAADTGVPNAVDAEAAKRIFRSVRSYES
ncbi:hypothetical protein ABZV58_00100 [Nocardia sp. NPDC004654]|uniref:hypothetical protein n=1 Tax=Nocardia sp. NPDC004654 TaxID=3154776 RepID=UPI0033A4764D